MLLDGPLVKFIYKVLLDWPLVKKSHIGYEGTLSITLHVGDMC